MPEADRKTCFVIGPIGSAESESRVHADWLLQEVIEPTMSFFPEYKVLRADRIARPGLIDAQVVNLLFDAEIVIADLSFHNPNAFYEIGIRHMRQLPIIHMHRTDVELPFDVTQYRSIPFSWIKAPELKAAREALKAQLDEVLAPGYQVDNPVSRARGRAEIEQRGSPAEQVLLETLDEVRRRVDRLERTAITIDPPQTSRDEFETLYVVFTPPPTQSRLEKISRLISNICKADVLKTRRESEKRYAFDIRGSISAEMAKALEVRLTSETDIVSADDIPF